MAKFQIPKGLFDILPDTSDDWRSSHEWSALEKVLTQIAESYGLKQVRTPIFERTELFQRNIGDTSDIVFKEMYTFEDKAKRSMTLRPEGTAPVLRALIESGTLHENPLQKLFYFGPYFRYDRPQAGRYRQFHQFGVEIIGVSSAEQDAELIEMLYTIFQALELKDLTLMINSIGNSKSRSSYAKALYDYFLPLKEKLSDDSKARLEANPLRILDSKDRGDILLAEGAPQITQYLDSQSLTHFEKVQEVLLYLNIPFKIEPKLCRGLDYYNETVFEFTASALGAQNTIGAGGRYDGLIGQMGGQNLPAIGFALGMERLLQTLLAQRKNQHTPAGPHILIIPLGEQERLKAMEMASKLRAQNLFTEVFLKSTKVKLGMQYAVKNHVQKVIVLGCNEMTTGEVKVKDMNTREEVSYPIETLDQALGCIQFTKSVK